MSSKLFLSALQMQKRYQEMVGSALATAANSSSSPSSKPSPYTYGLLGTDQLQNELFTKWLWYSLVVMCSLVLLGRFLQLGNAHIRHLFTLTATPRQQDYWSHNRGSLWPMFKKYFLYAPLWKKRHNREIRLSSALNFGTLPSRFHATLLVLYLVGNFVFMGLVDYSMPKASMLAELRGRSGHLAVVNIVPLVVLAGRNNPLIRLLRVSFDTYNLLHRWMGRIVVIEALVHTFAWVSGVVHTQGWSAVNPRISEKPFMIYGLAATVALCLILVLSPSVFRHAFYETFLHIHLVLVMTLLVTVYYHVKMGHLPQMPYMTAIAWLWGLERGARLAIILYRNFSRRSMTTVLVQALPGEACRVTFTVPRPWKFRPGCHVYITMPRISLWQSHPFSVAWSEESLVYDAPMSPEIGKEKLDLEQPGYYQTSYSLVVHKRTGMTSSLFEKATSAPLGQLRIRGFIEGPYGGLESLHSYGTVVLFAGGIGITHQVPHVRDLISRYQQGTIATKKILLVWIVRSTEHLEWVRPWMDKILQMPGRREVLRILLFVTKPKSPREVISPSATVQMFPGRPNPQAIIDKEVSERVGAMAVTVCGPGGLADNVRQAVRRRVDVASIDFVEEAFTW